MIDEITSRVWVVHFPDADHILRYQEPVTFARVMSEHHGALAAVPLQTTPPRRSTTDD